MGPNYSTPRIGGQEILLPDMQSGIENSGIIGPVIYNERHTCRLTECGDPLSAVANTSRDQKDLCRICRMRAPPSSTGWLAAMQRRNQIFRACWRRESGRQRAE